MRMSDRTKIKKPLKKRDSFQLRKKVCRFCTDKTKVIDYKDYKQLEYFIKDRGKMIPSRVSGNCAKHQRRVAEELKKARYLALLPYLRY